MHATAEWRRQIKEPMNLNIEQKLSNLNNRKNILKKKKSECLRDLWDCNKRCGICVSGVPEEEEREWAKNQSKNNV